MSDSSRLSPLDDVHVAAGAAFTDFAGWKMPVRYGSDLAEHETVRTAAGLFDLSHMAEFLVGGTHAGAFLDYALAGQASVIPLTPRPPSPSHTATVPRATFPGGSTLYWDVSGRRAAGSLEMDAYGSSR